MNKLCFGGVAAIVSLLLLCDAAVLGAVAVEERGGGWMGSMGWRTSGGDVCVGVLYVPLVSKGKRQCRMSSRKDNSFNCVMSRDLVVEITKAGKDQMLTK
ncbi:hypothetical protein L1987_13724 [Smallanthus sonchifolius]|uniref:Uncharacterized protein n=1 Tax=Smallanthus sonchifolius TaxID=185202 RepID=A0ACB9JIC2_9ASTR|nr:hypothetical protein L1987_13724 [Smallanthus sonchifolius]